MKCYASEAMFLIYLHKELSKPIIWVPRIHTNRNHWSDILIDTFSSLIKAPSFITPMLIWLTVLFKLYRCFQLPLLYKHASFMKILFVDLTNIFQFNINYCHKYKKYPIFYSHSPSFTNLILGLMKNQYIQNLKRM